MSEAEDVEPDLLGALAEEVARDPGPFVSGYVVLPDDRHFPDRFAPTRAGITTLLRRLHVYLGIPQLEPEVELELPDDAELVGATDAELVSVDRRSARYQVRYVEQADVVFALLEQAALAAVLARPTGSVGPFRDPAGEGDLERRPSGEPGEAFAATLLAIARGLGVLVAAGAHQYRAAGRIEGQMTRTAWRHVKRGALEPGAASFLVAAQLALRTDVDREAVLSALPRERADEVRLALPELSRDALIDAMDLPPPAKWPAPATYPVRPLRAPEAPDDEPSTPRERRRRRARERRTPVYRIRTTRWGGGAMLATVPGAVLGGLAMIAVGGGTGVGLAVMVATTVAGGLVGRRWWVDRCSDEDCDVVIPAAASRCPGCHRTIAGVVGTRTEALQASWSAPKDGRREE